MTTLPGTGIVDFSYNFLDASSHNNGNVQTIYNNLDWHRTQSFSYDSLNRISTAFTAADNTPAFQGDNSLAMCWAESFTYDAWGNLVTLGPNSTTQPNYVGCTQESGFNYTGAIGTNNRVTETGFTYDAAGNMTASPVLAYVYDAENHLTQTAGVTYTYDGDGKRVMKSNGTVYWYGTGSDAILETNLSASLKYQYFYFGGQRVGRKDGNNSVTWYFGDHLGSSRVVWSTAATDNSDFYPFGGERVIVSGTANTYKFTGKERDSESGLDNFGARYNSSTMGRFMSADQKQFTGRHLQYPQKWNKYAYVQNNPLLRFDPDGMDDYVVFRIPTAGTNSKQWADAKKAVESTVDSKGRQNTFHMLEGENATVKNYNTALNTPDTHVAFVGHALEDQSNPKAPVTNGIQLYDGESFGTQGSNTNVSKWDGDVLSMYTVSNVTPDASISASSVALFGCDTFNLASQYAGTNFTGVQSGPDGTTLQTLDSMAAAWVAAGGGQNNNAAANAAANQVIEQSPYPIDTGDNTESDTPEGP